MSEKIEEMLEQIKEYGQTMRRLLEEGQITAEEYGPKAMALAQLIAAIPGTVPSVLYQEYQEFFESFTTFCTQCGNADFLTKNVDTMASSLELFEECMTAFIEDCISKKKKCVCCGKEVVYLPLPRFYDDMKKKSGTTGETHEETINKKEYLCPVCGASDRDRLIISFLKTANLQKAPENFRVLQFAPAKSIESWIVQHCPHVQYESTDLFMDGVTYQSDIQNMDMVSDATYDLIICSHVLEHVRDDRKALQEMKRILKPDGKIVFLVPVSLDMVGIDEEWGLSEEENWKRFGQGDHCRRYGKQGLVKRLEEQFCVHCLGMEYFNECVFSQCGLTETSTLYVLTKEKNVNLDMQEQIIPGEDFCTDGPLVSVVMSCYNHEKFVGEAIESVLRQSYKNIEFLVADDGSDDNSVAVMKQYSDYYTQELYFSDNIGGRNRVLMDLAKGKYIAQMNSDDVWDENKIAMQVDYMEKHPECGVCFTWCEYVNENLQTLEDTIFIQKNRSRHEWMGYFWEHGNALCDPSSLMTKEMRCYVPAYGTTCWQLPDFFRWVDMVQKVDFHIIPKKLTKMRRYNTAGVSNVSANTPQNAIRHMMEEGCTWPLVIENMEKEFFKKAFKEQFIHSDAETDEEIMCEKYFLILKHYNVFVQNGAFYYLTSVFNEIRECMEKKYAYTKKDIKEAMTNSGLVPLFLKDSV